MDKVWQWFKEEIQTWTLSPRFPHEEESQDEYMDRIYSEAQCVYHCMTENMEKHHPELKEIDGEYESDTEWYDKYTDDVMDIITENISIV